MLSFIWIIFLIGNMEWQKWVSFYQISSVFKISCLEMKGKLNSKYYASGFLLLEFSDSCNRTFSFKIGKSPHLWDPLFRVQGTYILETFDISDPRNSIFSLKENSIIYSLDDQQIKYESFHLSSQQRFFDVPLTSYVIESHLQFTLSNTPIA